MEGLIQIPCRKVDPKEISYQAVCRETREEMGLHIILVYLITDKSFNCDIYTIDIGERISQWIESNKNRPWTFYTWVEQEVLTNQTELTPSFITFKRNIRRVICKKGKQSEHPIHKITIIEYPICEKMMKENQDHYYSPSRETDLTIFVDKPQ